MTSVGLWVLICALVAVAGVDFDVDDRSMREILTTTQCDFIRPIDEFPAQLQVYYLYEIYFEQPLDLSDLERTIATSITTTLNSCDDTGRPTFAVELSDSHHTIRVSDESSCGMVENCLAIRGTAAILVAGGVGGLASSVYKTIEATLHDTAYMHHRLGDNFLRAVFLESLGENLVIFGTSDDETPAPTTTESSASVSRVAITAVVVSVLLTCTILSLALFRQDHKGLQRKMEFISAKRRKFFQQLDDIQGDSSLPSGWMETDCSPSPRESSGLPLPWNISDLTSDAGSIKETLTLDRIEEGSDEDEPDSDDFISEILASSTNRSALNIDELEFIAHWDESVEISPVDQFDAGVPQEFWREEDEGSLTPVINNLSVAESRLLDSTSLHVSFDEEDKLADVSIASMSLKLCDEMEEDADEDQQGEVEATTDQEEPSAVDAVESSGHTQKKGVDNAVDCVVTEKDSSSLDDSVDVVDKSYEKEGSSGEALNDISNNSKAPNASPTAVLAHWAMDALSKLTAGSP